MKSEQMLLQQERNGTFASTIFCYAAASMLNVEIRITTLRSTLSHPTYALNSEATSGLTMFLGNITDFHFQSLIPSDDTVIDFQMVNNATTKKNGTRKRTSDNSSFPNNLCKFTKLSLIHI